MIGKVVNLDAYRKPQAKAVQKQRCPDNPLFCVTCDTDGFKLYSGGAVHCRSCGALISNLTVVRE